jgi:hypothetical protein
MLKRTALCVLVSFAWAAFAHAQATSPPPTDDPDDGTPPTTEAQADPHAMPAEEPVAEPPPAAGPTEAPAADTSPEAAAEATEAAEEEEEKPWTFAAGFDIYSRFIWRGVSFGDQWTLQPTASFNTHGFGFYVWASASPDLSSLVDYIGLTVSYAYTGSFGTFGADLADWIFTQHYDVDTGAVDAAAPYLFDFDNDGDGSHWLDLTAYYIGPEAFPLKVQFGVIAYNDPDHSLYAGLSYPVSVGRGFTLTPELGMVFGQSRRWYFTDDDPVNVTNCTVTLARSVDLGRGVTMPLSVAAIVNPESRRMHVVLGVGIRL